MEFDSLLSRADEVTLQALLGRPSIHLIMLLDETLATPARLRKLLLGLHTPQSLLMSKESRARLIDLLREPEARKLAQVLSLADAADVYGALRSVQAPQGSDRESRILGFFDLETPPLATTPAPESEQVVVGQYSLFEHQRRAARDTVRQLSDSPHRILLHMPTGAGKTRTAMHIIAEHLRTHEPALVVWLAHNEELCEQAAGEFTKAWSALGNREVGLYRIWGRRRINIENARDGLVVAGLSKVHGSIGRDFSFIGKLAGRCSLVVMDEAHQAIAPTYKLILDTLFLVGDEAALLGMTATPGRTWSDISSDEELAEFFAHRKVTLEVPGYNSPIDYLVKEGYLARVSFQPILQDGGLHLSPSDERLIQEKLEIPASVLKQLAENDQRNLAIVTAVEDLASRHQRILVFAASVEHSGVLATALRARGWRADSVIGGTPLHERARILEKFKDNSPHVRIVCNFGVLTTGFDAPRTNAALIARPTNSLVLYSQMVGRAIRGVKAGGNKEAEVATVIDQGLPGFRDIAEAFSNWEDVWRNS